MLGAIPTIAPYFLPSRLVAFAKTYPGIQVSIVEETTAVLLRHLREGNIDLALVALPVHGDELVTEELSREPLFVVLPQKHRFAKQSSITLREIDNDPFLLLKDGHCFRETTVAACRRARLRPRVVFESGHFSTILAMVAAGMGVSIVPEMAVESRAGCRFLKLLDQRSFRRIGLAHLRNHYQTRPQRALVETLREFPAENSRAVRLLA